MSAGGRRPSRSRIVGVTSRAERSPRSVGCEAGSGDEGEAVGAVLAGAHERERSDHADIGMLERVDGLAPEQHQIGVGRIRIEGVAHVCPQHVLEHGVARTRITAAPNDVDDLVTHRAGSGRAARCRRALDPRG